ncbi:Flp family type IVb pilin [Roseibium suaedae]|uniref:Pilus assembly protein Flp/PilA n=1 Tax=Roseibium suaedae TaxID=735517 RepID=A0A1M7A1Z2_9HYPH|nr:Flp family type IVb pilin [Roseibium suaedae]SHL36778.1 pilus assembly protein Flp/PilA [Roseibium suaedae]
MKKFLARFAKDESGATAIEYGLIAGLIAVALVTILMSTATSLTTVFTKIQTALGKVT